MAEKYLEFPKYKSQDLRGFRTSAGFTHHNTLHTIDVCNFSIPDPCLGSMVHEQHTEVLEGGAHLMAGHGYVRICQEPVWNPMPFPTLEWLFNRLFNFDAIKKTCPFPHHLNALLMAVGVSSVKSGAPVGSLNHYPDGNYYSFSEKGREDIIMTSRKIKSSD